MKVGRTVDGVQTSFSLVLFLMRSIQSCEISLNNNSVTSVFGDQLKKSCDRNRACMLSFVVQQSTKQLQAAKQ